MGDNDKKQLTEEETAELNARNSVLAFHQRTLDLLNSEYRLFLNHLLTSKGLDPAKKWEIDKEGTFIEVE